MRPNQRNALLGATAVVLATIWLVNSAADSSVRDASSAPRPAEVAQPPKPQRSPVAWPVGWCALADRSGHPPTVPVASWTPWGFHPQTDRGHQSPFINGDGLRLCADYAVNETAHRVFPVDVATGAADASVPAPKAAATSARPLTVFHRPQDAEHVLAFVQAQSALAAGSGPSPRFVLVGHNSDFGYPHYGGSPALVNATHALARLPQVEAVYAQNYVGIKDAALARKFHPIPIGIENRYNPFGKEWATYRSHACGATRSRPPKDRKKLLLVSIKRVSTASADRKALLEAAEKMAKEAPGRVTIATYGTLGEYLDAVAEHTFVAAPRGNGWDTHRAYDGWMMGSFVVTKRGPLDALYARLPSLLLDDWKGLTVSALEEARARLFEGLAAGTLDVEPGLLTARYWRQTLFPGRAGDSPLCPAA